MLRKLLLKRDPATGRSYVEEGRHAVPWNGELLNTPQLVSEFARKVLRTETFAEEQVYLIALDTKCKPLGYFQVSKGTISSSVVTPRECLVLGFLTGAASLILFHNHPSGDPTPSVEDYISFERCQKAGELVGVSFLDHVVVGDSGRYVSMRETEQRKDG